MASADDVADEIASILREVAAQRHGEPIKLSDDEWELLQPCLRVLTKGMERLEELKAEVSLAPDFPSRKAIILRGHLSSIVEWINRELGSLEASLSTLGDRGRDFHAYLMGWYVGTALDRVLRGEMGRKLGIDRWGQIFPALGLVLWLSPNDRVTCH